MYETQSISKSPMFESNLEILSYSVPRLLYEFLSQALLAIEVWIHVACDTFTDVSKTASLSVDYCPYFSRVSGVEVVNRLRLPVAVKRNCPLGRSRVAIPDYSL